MSIRTLITCGLLLSSSFANANIICQAAQIQPWPQNPVITISRAKTPGLVKIEITRSFYGVSMEDSFVSRVNSNGQIVQMMDAKHKLTLQATELSGLENVLGQIESDKDGIQEVVCRGGL